MIGVIFWSGTGNTERMAYEVAEGIKAAGQDVEVKSVSEVSVDEAAAYDKLALGCADMGAEQLEEGEFEPFYTELEGKILYKDYSDGCDIAIVFFVSIYGKVYCFGI